MTISDLIWAALGVLGLVIGLIEIIQGKVLLALSALVIGALLIASAAVKLVKKT